MRGNQVSRAAHGGYGGYRARQRALGRADSTGDEGITLIEVIVSFTILLITILPLTFLLTSALSSASDARQRQAALQLADSWMEVLSNSSLPTSGGIPVTNDPQNPVSLINTATTPVPQSTLAGTTFSVTANFITQSVDNQGQSDLCSSGQPPSQSHPGVIVLQVTVSWNNGNSSVSDTTALNYPTPGLQTQGFLGVQVANATGVSDVNGNTSQERLEAVPVTITETAQAQPPTVPAQPWLGGAQNTPVTFYPDENGCVFAQVPTGTYTVAIGQPVSGTPKTFNGYSGTPPFVTTSGATSESQSTTVDVTAETDVNLNQFDEGITSSISYGAATGIDNGVFCPGASSLTCATLGNGATGASASWGGASANWSSTSFAGVTNLNDVACTSGGSPTCVAVGSTTTSTSATGVIRTSSSGLSGATTDTPPAGVTDITQVACPSTHGCYALGTTASGQVLLAGAVGQSSPNVDTWKVIAPASTTFTSLNSLVCPTTSVCEVSGSAIVGVAQSAPMIAHLGGDPAAVATNAAWEPTWYADSLPTAVTSASTITCPTTTLCEALAAGDSHSSTDPTVLTAAIAAGSASTWTDEPTFPTGAGSLTGISCTTTSCVAIGTTSSGAPAAWTSDQAETPHDWATAGGPTLGSSSITAFTSVSCGQPTSGDTDNCVITADTTSVVGQLLVGSLTGESWSWNQASLPQGTTVRYYVDATCEPSPSSTQSVCAAVGVTPSGPVVLTTASGPAGAWTVNTPSALTGATVTGIPLETAPSGSNNFTTQVAAVFGASNVTTLPSVLYPQPGGYSIAAGDCLAEGTNAAAVTSLSAAPGGNASATIPLGLLPLQLVNPLTHLPVSGAIITLTATTCGASGDRYTLPVTDAQGYTQSAVPYGSYSYTVTIAGIQSATNAVSFQVNTGTIVESSGGSVVSTTYLPGPAWVPSL
jgi:Tfp pilus assembly protein PilV